MTPDRRLPYTLVIATCVMFLSSCGEESPGTDTTLVTDSIETEATVRLTATMPMATGMAAHGGTLFSIVSPDGVVRATAGFSKTWNSYCASNPLQLRFFLGDASQYPLSIERLGKPDPLLRTGYGFSDGKSLIVVDIANNKQFRNVANPELGGSEWQELSREQFVGCPQFTLDGWVYPQSTDMVQACQETDEDHVVCDEMAIHQGTFVYAFGDAGGNVVAATNWGDVLIHRPDGWCRAVDDGEGYACPPEGSPPAQARQSPSGIQFYSSIKYRGETLMGRFPGGLIYRFDGTRLAPYEDTTPLPKNNANNFAEAQSMASYCGDLYVGFWPLGELWSRSLNGGEWRKVTRMFSHPVSDQPTVPYVGSEPVGTAGAFLGQRVNALVPQGDHLYVTTSNLRDWTADIPTPDFLTTEQIDEYGTVYALHREGCMSAQLSESGSSRIHFDFTPSRISIRQGTRLLAEIPNPGFIPSPRDQIVRSSPAYGEGLASAVSFFEKCADGGTGPCRRL